MVDSARLMAYCRDMKDEDELREVPGYPGYFVTFYGKIKGRSGRWLKPEIDSSGYFRIRCYFGSADRSKRLFVHHAVLLAWVALRPEGYVGRHTPDRDRSNNRADNLAWGTHMDNIRDSLNDGTHVSLNDIRGSKAPAAKLSEIQIIQIRSLLANGLTHQEISNSYNVSRQAITRISSGKSYKTD